MTPSQAIRAALKTPQEVKKHSKAPVQLLRGVTWQVVALPLRREPDAACSRTDTRNARERFGRTCNPG